MLWEIPLFIAIFVLSCASGVFSALLTSMMWGVWGGIKPLSSRINAVEDDLGALEGRFTKQQKRTAADRSAEVKSAKMSNIEFLMAKAASDRKSGDEIEYVG